MSRTVRSRINFILSKKCEYPVEGRHRDEAEVAKAHDILESSKEKSRNNCSGFSFVDYRDYDDLIKPDM